MNKSSLVYSLVNEINLSLKPINVIHDIFEQYIVRCNSQPGITFSCMLIFAHIKYARKSGLCIGIPSWKIGILREIGICHPRLCHVTYL